MLPLSFQMTFLWIVLQLGETFSRPKHVPSFSLLLSEACTINFELQNYTIITSKCKGPDYLPDPCCSAFKEFACPFAQELNDLTNNCATTMFNSINLNGKYPPGLFASECREDKEGLACPALPPSQSTNSNDNQITSKPSPVLILAAAFLVLLRLMSISI